MANPEHLVILKRGVGSWNTWKRENRTLLKDLREADLSGAQLNGIDLGGADLY
jgi:hypothetical protein